MLDLALKGSKKYWIWMTTLLVVLGVGFFYYMKQLIVGLTITGLGRDVSWGMYIAQLNFMVGVAAGGVMLVLPYYLHDYKKFGKITILGEFLAVPALTICMIFQFVDLGKPNRFLNFFLHPTPTAMPFWDGTVILTYLILNIVLGWVILESERKSVPPPSWTRPLIYLSIPTAFGIHTVTAFLYCGLPGRSYWLTAVLAPRFLASAFSAGPALLILISFLLRRFSRFDPGKEAIQMIAKIITYALIANVFCLVCEVFVAFYSNIPEHKLHIIYMFAGIDGKHVLVPWMWASVILLLSAIILLVYPVTRKNERILGYSCVAVFTGTWIDKGFGMMAAGFTPSPLHRVMEYIPTVPEISITLGVYAIGLIILTVLYKIVISVKEEIME